MSLVWMLLEKLTGLHGKYIDYHLYLTNLFAIPTIWFMVLALKDKKKNFYNGTMNYQQVLFTGIIISVIVALFIPLTQWIISYVITPEYFPNVIKRSVEIGYYKTTAEAHFNFPNDAKESAIGAFVMRVITTAIAMIFIKSKKQFTIRIIPL